MCVNERDTGITVKMQGAELVKLDESKCLGSTIVDNVQLTKEEESSCRVEWVEKSVGVICE